MIKFLKMNKYKFYKNYCLKDSITLKSRDKCKYFVLVKNYNELYKLVDYLDKIKKKYLILGNGSKVVFVNNYSGVVISLKELNNINIYDTFCEVEAGALISKLIDKLKNNNIGGIEELIGIPSSIGGGLANNISAHNVALSDYLISLIVYKNNEIIEIKKDQIIFDYRYSSLKNNCIILKAKFKFINKNKKEISNNIIKYINYRKIHQETAFPNIGSIFKNNIKPASQIVKECKLVEYKYHGVGFSKKHSNFISIKKNKKGKLVYKFVKKVQKKVFKLKKIHLESEINFIYS